MSDPRSLYIHIPFCVKKCRYCDFYSETRLFMISDYVRGLEKEIQNRCGSGGENEINTLYFGGGTPSLLRVQDVDVLMRTVEKNFSVSPDVEVTLEVNPGTVDFSYLKGLKDAGVNRLSVGVQSFDDDKLGFLGRIHTADQARQTLHDARTAGFDNISMDLIYGIPYETWDTWVEDLSEAMKFSLPHLSCYTLTIEPETPLYFQWKKGLIPPPDKSSSARLFQKTVLFLEKFGHDHYEISSFSKGKKNRSRHNSAYWDMTPYHGFGPSAHSYDGNTRAWNYKNIDAYMQALRSGDLPVEARETLTREQKMIEMILLRFRTLEGLDLEKFQNEFSISFELLFKDLLDRVCKDSLGAIEDKRFALTLEGKTRLDGILEAFAEKIPC